MFLDSIHINSILPSFFSASEITESEIWGREVRFRKGEYHLISAVSGTGKSSLLSYIFGERDDYKGDIIFYDHTLVSPSNNFPSKVEGSEIKGRSLSSMKPAELSKMRQHGIGFVFQGLRLFSELTAFENITLKNKLTGCKTDDEIKSMLKCAGLAEKINEKAARLSFGQQQRVAIIRALCQPFDFLLMDEPFSHLDDYNIKIMAGMISQELSSRQAGMVLCSLGVEYPFVYSRKWKL